MDITALLRGARLAMHMVHFLLDVHKRRVQRLPQLLHFVLVLLRFFVLGVNVLECFLAFLHERLRVLHVQVGNAPVYQFARFLETVFVGVAPDQADYELVPFLCVHV